MQYTLLSEFASFDVNKNIVLNSSNSVVSSVRLDSDDIDII